MSRSRSIAIVNGLIHGVLVVAGAVALTLVFFLVLPLIQTINHPPETELVVRSVETADVPPPPPPPEEKPPDEPEPETKPPELQEVAQPLSLEQLEVALNNSIGEGWGDANFAVNLPEVVAVRSESDELYSVVDLDQQPRVLYQPGPTLTSQIRKKAPGTVYIIFIVDQQGRVENPTIQSTSDEIFNTAALAAVKQWKFEPGKRNGQPVRFRMRVPVTFPKGR